MGEPKSSYFPVDTVQVQGLRASGGSRSGLEVGVSMIAEGFVTYKH